MLRPSSRKRITFVSFAWVMYLLGMMAGVGIDGVPGDAPKGVAFLVAAILVTTAADKWAP